MEEMPKEMQKEEGVGTLLNNKYNQFQPNIATYNQIQPNTAKGSQMSQELEERKVIRKLELDQVYCAGLMKFQLAQLCITR